MCGLTGFINFDISSSNELERIISSMTSSLIHRGPDDFGVWLDTESKIALGHRRLSVLDLSKAGHQPMQSIDSRYTIAFNGEIYNHLELRKELEKGNRETYNWVGTSDTETLIPAIAEWGIESTLKSLVGMFAMAVWDNKDETLTLARDRFGEKPLYYGLVNNSFVFGSELKAIKNFPGFTNPISRKALSDYLRFLYVPSPKSIYEDIYKLEPGSFLEVKATQNDFKNYKISKYWSFDDQIRAGNQDQFYDESEAIGSLELALDKSIRSQLLSDVPLGAFLSGGIDSSLIVALMQNQASSAIKTFTVAFEESQFDESPFASKVANHLGTDHYEMHVSSLDARNIITELPEIYDEPFADSSQIPTFLIAAHARKEVTVSLSGDAGDELFGGYNRYFWAPRIWNKVSWMPYYLRNIFAANLGNVSENNWERTQTFINSVQKGLKGIDRLGEKAHKLSETLVNVRNIEDLYFNLLSVHHDPSKIVIDTTDYDYSIKDLSGVSPKDLGIKDSPSRMMYWDVLNYLPDDILCKVDRAAMANSLETRIPFLDPGVVDVSLRLPLNMKIRDNEGKWALRQILYKHVPKELIERPKTGFSIPLGLWLRGPLRDWAESLLDEQRLRDEGYFYPDMVRKLWLEHINGKKDWGTKLWSILMFQSWYEANN